MLCLTLKMNEVDYGPKAAFLPTVVKIKNLHVKQNK